MIRKIIFVMNVVFVSYLLNCMESIKQETGNDQDNPQIIIDIPQLDMNKLNNKYNNSSGSINSQKTPKTPIGKGNQVSDLVKARSQKLVTQRKTPNSSLRGAESSSGNKASIQGSAKKVNFHSNDDSLNQKVAKGLDELFSEDKADRELGDSIIQFDLDNDEKTWLMIMKLNRQIYNFAKNCKMSANEAMVYAELLDEFQVHPEAFVEHIKKINNLSDKQASWEVDYYKGIQKKDPEKYESLVLAFMKELFDKDDGKPLNLTVHNEHIVAQEKQIVGQDSFIKKLTVSNVMSGVATVVLGIWAIYAQIASSIPPSQNCTG